mmetsp:Transcript_62561/g.146763  ORF Transcript_62561/g.146763 Transcript_62561/m.146763 type:complete len:235 (-) Transcript_62561:1625-2329(-)
MLLCPLLLQGQLPGSSLLLFIAGRRRGCRSHAGAQSFLDLGHLFREDSFQGALPPQELIHSTLHGLHPSSDKLLHVSFCWRRLARRRTLRSVRRFAWLILPGKLHSLRGLQAKILRRQACQGRRGIRLALDFPRCYSGTAEALLPALFHLPLPIPLRMLLHGPHQFFSLFRVEVPHVPDGARWQSRHNDVGVSTHPGRAHCILHQRNLTELLPGTQCFDLLSFLHVILILVVRK